MFKPLSNERAFETIAKQLKEAIYSRKLKPGDKLPTERELAKMFSSSRAAVRSAVLSLEQSGLLKIQKGAGGGFFIQELDFRPVRNSLNELLRLGKASIADLAEARRVLEPEAARLAAKKATSSDITKMEQSVLHLEQRMTKDLPRQANDFDFHVCVAEGSKNPIIITIMQSLMDLLFQSVGSYVLEPDQNEEIIKQHKKILDAIKANDPEKSQASALEHVKAMRGLFKQYELTENHKSRASR
ncbi:MAG: FadR family transcriptional regulator [Deltaproteobacteria bacterium]|nr:FadR family transcriptional regulator [Deltaproteobacteria bacterium]